MNPECLSILRNPMNQELLDLTDSPSGQVLIGRESGTIFSVREGIPVFIDPDRISAANRKSSVYYDILAPFYRFTQSVHYRLKGGEEKWRNEYLKFAGVREGNRVLEVSIGNGANLRSLPRNAEYFRITFPGDS